MKTIDGWDCSIDNFDENVLIRITCDGMKRFKVFRAYHVDTDELVIELKEYGKEVKNERRTSR